MIVGLSAGGGAGGILTVMGTTGDTATVSKDGKTFDANGSAVFKGLASGVWTVTMRNNIGQTSTKTIEITADYLSTISYFSATISVTYPANSTCVVTDSSGATVASDTNTDTNAKTWTATVGSTGTYTITATETGGSKTKTATVSIAAEGESKSVTIGYTLEIYNAGVFGTDTSGEEFTVGTRTDYNSITQNSNNLKWRCDANTSNLFYVSPKISPNGFSTLKMRISASNMNGAGQFGLAKGKTNASSDYVAKTSFNAFTGGKTLSVDISGVTSGTYYIKLTQDGDSDADTTATITHIWLE